MSPKLNNAPQTFVMMTVDELEAREKSLRESILNEVQSLIKSASTPKEFLTTDDVIARYGFSQSTLWRMEQNGTLVPHRSGRKRLFAVKDIENAIRK